MPLGAGSRAGPEPVQFAGRIRQSSQPCLFLLYFVQFLQRATIGAISSFKSSSHLAGTYMIAAIHTELIAALGILQYAGFNAIISLERIVSITATRLDGHRFEASGNDMETALRNLLVLAGFDNE